MDSNAEHIILSVDNYEQAAALRRERPFSCPAESTAMVKPAHLVRATSRILPSSAPSIARSAWTVAADAGLRPVRPLGPVQGELTTREIAGMIVARLSGDSKPEIATYAGHLGRLRCVKPYVVQGGVDPFGAVGGAPDSWRQTTSLPAGHSLLDLVEALVVDAAGGRMAEGEHWLRYVTLTFRCPSLFAELRLSQEGKDILDGGGRLAAAIAPLAGLRASYAIEAPSLPASLPEALRAAARSTPSPSRIVVSRSLDLGVIVDLLEEMQND